MTDNKNFEAWNDDDFEEVDDSATPAPDADEEETPEGFEEYEDEYENDPGLSDLLEDEVDESAEGEGQFDPNEPVAAEEEAPKKKGSTGKILMWTGVTMLSGFAMIAGYFLFMVPPQRQSAAPAAGIMNQMQTEEPVKMPVGTTVSGAVPEKTNPANPYLPQDDGLAQQTDDLLFDDQAVSGQEVEPVLISEVPSEQLPEALRPAQQIDPLTGAPMGAPVESPAMGQTQIYAEQEVVEEQAPVVAGTFTQTASVPAVGSMQSRGEEVGNPEELITRLEKMQAVLEAHSQRIDILLGVGSVEMRDAGDGQMVAVNTEKERADALAQSVEALTHDKALLADKIGKLEGMIAGLKAEQKKLAAQNKELNGANDWLRTLHKKQAQQIKTLEKELAHMKTQPIFPGWKIVGMTDKEAILSDDYRLLRLRPGSSYEGITIKAVDFSEGTIVTNYGKVKYDKIKKAK